MTRVSSLEPGWKYILGINVRLAGSVAMLWGGHVLWEARSVEWWGLGLMSVLLIAGGAAHALRGVIDVVRLIVRQRQVKRFQRMGGEAKADVAPDHRDLQDRGMLR